MDSSKNEAGRITERIIKRIKEKGCELKGAQHNTVWAAAYEVLQEVEDARAQASAAIADAMKQRRANIGLDDKEHIGLTKREA